MATDPTEDSILSNIPDFQDDNDAGDTTTTETTQETSTTTEPTTGTVAAPSAEGGATNAPAQPATPAVVRRDGLVEQPSKDDPRARDLVDPATGQVVARGGIERRIFEGAQKVHRDNQQLMQRATRAEEQLKNTTELTRTAATLGLAPADQVMSLNLMSQFLKDPVKVLEQLVVEVKSKGYAIPFLENGVTPGMDTAAMQRMIDQKMQPFTAANQQREQQQVVQQQAKATLDGFLDQHPEGQHNLTVLAEMMTSEPGLTIENAYVKFVKWAAQNGLDYSQPIQPQITARRAQQPVANAAPTPQPRTPQAPLPNGRPTNTAAPVNAVRSFDENSSWSDILRHSMKESGFSAA